MSELIRLIWDICCLRRGPQDVPYAPALLLLLCALSLGFEAIASGEAVTVAIGAGVLAFYLLALNTLLRARALGNRFVQTATALIGCALVFDLMMLPLQLMLGDVKTSQPTPAMGLVVIGMLMVLAWKLIVDAQIFRHALNISFMLGLAIALGWFLLVAYLLNLLVPVPPAS